MTLPTQFSGSESAREAHKERASSFRWKTDKKLTMTRKREQVENQAEVEKRYHSFDRQYAKTALMYMVFNDQNARISNREIKAVVNRI